MEKQCKICGGELIETRLRTGAYLLGTAPVEDDRKIKPRYSTILCDTCVECGNIERIYAEKPEKLK